MTVGQGQEIFCDSWVQTPVPEALTLSPKPWLEAYAQSLNPKGL